MRHSIIKGVAEALAITGGFLDAVVHNAGVAAGGAFEDIPDAEVRRVMETNLFGVMALTRALLPTFRKQRSGRIVIVSSESGLVGQPCNSIYVSSKWAVEGWAESLAFEVEQFGVEVLLVEPGPYITDIWQASPRFSPENSAYRPWAQYLFRAIDAHVAANGRRSAGGRRAHCARAGGAATALPQSGGAPGAHRSFCAREIPEPLAAPRISRPIWARGACACSLIATAAQALGYVGCASLKSRQIPCKYCPPPYRSR